MGLVITTHTKSFTVELNGLSVDRKKARIKYEDIRSLVTLTDNATVNIIFTNGEIYGFPFQAVTTIDGVGVTDQDDLFDTMEAKIFS